MLRNTSYLGSDFAVVSGKDLLIRDGVISEIKDTEPQASPVEVILDGRDLFWMPGLVDGHTHTSQQLLRGRLLDEKPVIWKRINVPFESRLTEETSRLSAQLAALEMIKSGTTGFVDAGGKYAEVFAEVYQESGLRGRLTYMTNDSPAAPDSLRTSSKEALGRLRSLNRALSGRLRAYYSVTTLTAVSRELFHQVLEAGQEDGVPVEIHMNEYSSEVLDFIERYGERPFVYMERQGLLKGQLIAPHCIFLSEEEMDILAQRQVRVVHCPFSNCGKGIPPTPGLLRRGVSVGFGSDGTAHGGMDLFRELRLFRSLMQVHYGVPTADAGVMPAQALLKMATQGGAAALCEELGGMIQPGQKADLIAVDLNQPHLFPTQNLIHTLVESATGHDVRHMIVDGRLLMRDRQVLTLDEDQILASCHRIFERDPWLNDWH